MVKMIFVIVLILILFSNFGNSYILTNKINAKLESSTAQNQSRQKKIQSNSNHRLGAKHTKF